MSWISGSWFCVKQAEWTVGAMDVERMDEDRGHAAGPDSAGGEPKRPLAWSIARVIALLDEAIDSAGAQLAESAGLWADSPDELSVFRTPDGRRPVRSRSSSALDPLDDSAAERVIESP